MYALDKSAAPEIWNYSQLPVKNGSYAAVLANAEDVRLEIAVRNVRVLLLRHFLALVNVLLGFQARGVEAGIKVEIAPQPIRGSLAKIVQQGSVPLPVGGEWTEGVSRSGDVEQGTNRRGQYRVVGFGWVDGAVVETANAFETHSGQLDEERRIVADCRVERRHLL